jgi:hypothetical protein
VSTDHPLVWDGTFLCCKIELIQEWTMKREFLPAAAVVVFLTLPASAAIRCNGNYQVVNGSEISTPYCRDQQLARLGRKSGFKYSDSEIRNSPTAKRELCRYMKSDIEVQTACGEVDGDRSRF